ncbi:MAG: AsmA family protein, partial [Pseudomonadota bacterium]
MRFITYLFAFLFLLVAAAVVVIPMIVPAEELEARVETAATNALGREVTIEGAPKISVFPTRVQVAGLKVANAEGFSAPHLLSVEAADIGVKLLPLIQGQVEITHFNLDAPDIRL